MWANLYDSFYIANLTQCSLWDLNDVLMKLANGKTEAGERDVQPTEEKGVLEREMDTCQVSFAWPCSVPGHKLATAISSWGC